MGCKIFRVGVFFDGTGNTKHPDSSKGKQSNVAKLSKLYKQGDHVINGQKYTFASIYKNGVGTYDYDILNKFAPTKFGKGAGAGGADRINEAIDELFDILNIHKVGTDEHLYKERIIDVFGFSRGAAMARDFVNTFNKRNKKWKLKEVRFNFIGIFDTVGSFGVAGNNINMKPTRDNMLGDEGEIIWGLDAFTKVFQENENKPGYEPYNFNLARASAKRIVHMTAHDELRFNFPLTNIQGAGEEWSLIGVHSDIGGGYAPQEHEPHTLNISYLSSDKAKKVAIAEAAKRNAQNGAYSLIGDWQAIEPTKISSYDKFHACQRIRYAPTLMRTVNNHLAKVTYHLMYDEAIDSGVPFEPMDETLPLYLQDYYYYAKAAKQQAFYYADSAQGEKIKAVESHHSAVDTKEHIHTGYKGHTSLSNAILHDSADGLGGNDIRSVTDSFSGESKAKRAIFANIPKQAVKPI